MEQKKRSHKKFWIAGTVVVVILAMAVSCTTKKEEPQQQATAETVKTEAVTEAAVEQPVKETEKPQEAAADTDTSSGAIGDYEISIIDAVQTTDYNGKPAIVVNFNYKNNSSSANMFATSVVYNAYQNGVGLSPTVILNGTYDAQLSMKNIQPGAELKVQAAYALSDNSPVTVEVTPIINLNNTKLTKVFDIDR